MGYNVNDIFYLNLPIIGHEPLRHMEMLQLLEIVSSHEYKVKNLNDERFVIDTRENIGLFYDINITQNFLLRLGFKCDADNGKFLLVVKNTEQDVLVTIERNNDRYRLINKDINGVLRGYGIIANYPMLLQTFKTLFGFEFPFDIKSVAKACGAIPAKYATYHFDLSKSLFRIHSWDEERKAAAEIEFNAIGDTIISAAQDDPNDEFLQEMVKVVMKERQIQKHLG